MIETRVGCFVGSRLPRRYKKADDLLATAENQHEEDRSNEILRIVIRISDRLFQNAYDLLATAEEER
jgi:hypothetical protein